MFLMYTVSYGGRSILVERSLGTLPRLLVSPTSTTQVLGGKVLGIYLTGVAQMLILIVASSTLLFRLHWGDPLARAGPGAGGGLWGHRLGHAAHRRGAHARAGGGNVGSAVMLMFGILGGSFIDTSNLPVWVQWISKITPNAWGLDGFSTLATGGSLADLGAPVLALLVMGAALFGAAVLLFNRSSIVER